MALPKHASPLERIWHYTYLALCVAIFVFLMAPILIVIPLRQRQRWQTEPAPLQLRYVSLHLLRLLGLTVWRLAHPGDKPERATSRVGEVPPYFIPDSVIPSIKRR